MRSNRARQANEGFPPIYKPSGTYFDLCAQGRLLVLSPSAYTARKQELTRERCLQMNQWVEEVCGPRCAPTMAHCSDSGRPFLAARQEEVQPDVPPENIVAMCDELKIAGRYPLRVN